MKDHKKVRGGMISRPVSYGFRSIKILNSLLHAGAACFLTGGLEPLPARGLISRPDAVWGDR